MNPSLQSSTTDPQKPSSPQSPKKLLVEAPYDPETLCFLSVLGQCWLGQLDLQMVVALFGFELR
jgi:hypothetical protein